jgi:hypothetical protein
VDDQNNQKITKRLALFSGLTIALIFCGIPLAYTVITGRFQQFTQPFTYAAQTAVVMPLVSDTPANTVVVFATPTDDIATLTYSQRYDIAGPYISEALDNSW